MDQPLAEGTDWASLDWEFLSRVRSGFLSAKNGIADYWSSESGLRSYHVTFGERIGWKWDALIDELRRIGWSPPGGVWWDWGCGTGIAISRALAAWPGLASEVILWDRSGAVRHFAAARLRAQFPGLTVRVADRPPHAGDFQDAFVLLSHVWNELPREEQGKLPSRLRDAAAVLWMEPGSKDTGRGISEIREILREHFTLTAPCPHQGPCGMLAPDRRDHWCHFHARAPTLAFTDPGWRAFSEMLSIDLRRLAYSYLCADKTAGLAKPDRLSRPTGLPTERKHGVRWYDCRDDGTLADAELSKREAPAMVKEMAKGKAGPWLEWQGAETGIPPVRSWP